MKRIIELFTMVLIIFSIKNETIAQCNSLWVHTQATDLTVNCGDPNIDNTINTWVTNGGGSIVIDPNTSTQLMHESSDYSTWTCGVQSISWVFVNPCNDDTTTISANLVVEDLQAPLLVGSPTNLTVSCENIPDLDDQYYSNFYFADNCQLEFSLDPSDPNFAQYYNEVVNGNIITRTYTAFDACGNSTSAVWTITTDCESNCDSCEIVVDMMPTDLTVNSSSPFMTSNIISWINLGGNASVSNGCGEQLFPCPIDTTWNCGSQEIQWVYYACDSTSNDTLSATLTIIDDVAPENIWLPNDLWLECRDTTLIEATLDSIAQYGFTDDCCLDTVSFVYDLHNCGGPYGNAVIITAQDCNGNVNTLSSNSFVIYVVDTIAPSVNLGTNPTFDCSDSVQLITDIDQWLSNNGGLAANDCNGPVTWSHNFSGNYPVNNGDQVNVMFTATDDCGNTSSETLTIAASCSTSCDSCEIIVDTMPTDLTVNSSSAFMTSDIISWMNLGGGASVSNGCGEQLFPCPIDTTWNCGSQEIQWVYYACDSTSTDTLSATLTIIDDVNPVFTNIPDNLSINCNDTVAVQNWLNQFAASDNCCLDSVTNSFSGALNCTNGTIIYVTATDCSGNSTSVTGIVYLNDTIPPTISGGSDLTIACGDTLAFDNWLVQQAGANADDCSGFTWSNDFNGNYPSSDGETIDIAFTAADPCGNNTSVTFTVTASCPVDSCALYWSMLPEDSTILCGAEWPIAEATAQQVGNCPDSLQVFFTEDLVKGCPDTLFRNFVATNGIDSIFHTQVLVRIDTSAPEFLYLPDTITLACNDTTSLIDELQFIESGVVDCGAVNSVSFEYQLPDCGTNTTMTVIATDDCGNTTQVEVVVVVEENDNMNNDCILLVESSVSQILCNGETGSIQLAITSSDEVIVSWNNDMNGMFLHDIQAGTYIASISGCKDTTVTVILDEPEALSMDIQVTNKICGTTNNDGQAIVNVSGGTAPYSYEYSHTFNTTNNPIDLPKENNQIVVVTDANGCQVMQNFDVNCTECVINIAGRELFVSVTDPEDFTSEVGVYTLTGSKVFTGTVQISNGFGSETFILPSSLNTGMYIVTVTLPGGKMKVEKILVN